MLRAFTGSRGRTFDLLRACIASYGDVDAHVALVYLMSHGWESESRGNPLNAVRSALAHLAASGEIERVSRGVYRSTAQSSNRKTFGTRCRAANNGAGQPDR
jgi:hypothetical protein